jgi:hypothetical protein
MSEGRPPAGARASGLHGPVGAMPWGDPGARPQSQVSEMMLESPAGSCYG